MDLLRQRINKIEEDFNASVLKAKEKRNKDLKDVQEGCKHPDIKTVIEYNYHLGVEDYTDYCKVCNKPLRHY